MFIDSTLTTDFIVIPQPYKQKTWRYEKWNWVNMFWYKTPKIHNIVTVQSRLSCTQVNFVINTQNTSLQIKLYSFKKINFSTLHVYILSLFIDSFKFNNLLQLNLFLNFWLYKSFTYNPYKHDYSTSWLQAATAKPVSYNILYI